MHLSPPREHSEMLSLLLVNIYIWNLLCHCEQREIHPVLLKLTTAAFLSGLRHHCLERTQKRLWTAVFMSSSKCVQVYLHVQASWYLDVHSAHDILSVDLMRWKPQKENDSWCSSLPHSLHRESSSLLSSSTFPVTLTCSQRSRKL